MYCIVLYCTVLYCTLLYYTVLYFTVLYLLHTTVLYCTALYSTVLLPPGVKPIAFNKCIISYQTCTRAEARIIIREDTEDTEDTNSSKFPNALNNHICSHTIDKPTTNYTLRNFLPTSHYVDNMKDSRALAFVVQPFLHLSSIYF